MVGGGGVDHPGSVNAVPDWLQGSRLAVEADEKRDGTVITRKYRM